MLRSDRKVTSRDGRLLGSVAPKAGADVLHAFKVPLGKLAADPGIGPGDRVYLSMYCPDSGGHEYGVWRGSGFDPNTTCKIPTPKK